MISSTRNGRILKISSDKKISNGQLQRERGQLQRLKTLIDTVFAVVIVMIVFDLPSPDESVVFDLSSFVAFRIESLAVSMLGIIVLMIYWFQSNLLLGNLERTDGKHAAISLLQIFMVLAYLLSVSLGISVGTEPLVLAVQSGTAALVGLFAAAAWWYASYNRQLLTPEATDGEVAALRLRVLAEPLTAVLTLGLAFVSAAAWEIGWFAYPLIAAILRKAGVAGIAATDKNTNEQQGGE